MLEIERAALDALYAYLVSLHPSREVPRRARPGNRVAWIESRREDRRATARRAAAGETNYPNNRNATAAGCNDGISRNVRRRSVNALTVIARRGRHSPLNFSSP